MTANYTLSRAGWRTSSYTNGGEACVEVSVWHKSSYSTNGGDCVEVGVMGGGVSPRSRSEYGEKLVAVRDSKDPEGPRLCFTPADWDAFRRGMQSGAFDHLA
jgi:hypothetical protein